MDCRQQEKAADSTEVTRFVSDADALFFQGGDQAEYLAVWRETTLQQAVQSKVGVVTIGGTSAGMHIMSSSIYEPSPADEGVGSDAAAETPRA